MDEGDEKCDPEKKVFDAMPELEEAQESEMLPDHGQTFPEGSWNSSSESQVKEEVSVDSTDWNWAHATHVEHGNTGSPGVQEGLDSIRNNYGGAPPPNREERYEDIVPLLQPRKPPPTNQTTQRQKTSLPPPPSASLFKSLVTQCGKTAAPVQMYDPHSRPGPHAWKPTLAGIQIRGPRGGQPGQELDSDGHDWQPHGFQGGQEGYGNSGYQPQGMWNSAPNMQEYPRHQVGGRWGIGVGRGRGVMNRNMEDRMGREAGGMSSHGGIGRGRLRDIESVQRMFQQNKEPPHQEHSYSGGEEKSRPSQDQHKAHNYGQSKSVPTTPNTPVAPVNPNLPQPPSMLLFQNLSKSMPPARQGPKLNQKLSQLEERLLDMLRRENKPFETLPLARGVGMHTKKDINPSLYHLQTLGHVVKCRDHPPMWKARADSLAVTTRERSPPAEERHKIQRMEPGPLDVGRSGQHLHSPTEPLGHAFPPRTEMNNRPQEPRFNRSFSTPILPSQPPRPQSIPKMNGNANQALTKVAFSAINKNPVSALNEYAQANRMEVTFEVVRESKKTHKPSFTMVARMGNQIFPEVSASNTKEARRQAADVALRQLLGNSYGGGNPSGEVDLVQDQTMLSGNLTHFDRMAAISHSAFMQLAAAVPDKFAGRKVVACMIMKSGDSAGEVVSLGTGNRCITGQRLSMEGKVVNDSHAEIVARRGLMRFFYSHIENLYKGADSIFIEDECSGKLKLRDGITFHLYISTAPCGDGALFTPREGAGGPGMASQETHQHQPTFTTKQQGILRTKIEDGEGTIPIDPNDGIQTWDGLLRGCRLRTMSCSDKICRWNIVGLQGALLSHFMDPVYLQSLTLGYLYDHGHLSRAICCRLEKDKHLSELPSSYRVNHPMVGRVTAYEQQRETEKTNNLSINWSFYDTNVEVTDGRTGACMSRTNNSPTPSRVCKAFMYSRFRQLCGPVVKNHHLLEAENYREAKSRATDFQLAKKRMFEQFRASKFGTWVSKPLEQELFEV